LFNRLFLVICSRCSTFLLCRDILRHDTVVTDADLFFDTSRWKNSMGVLEILSVAMDRMRARV